MRATVLVRPKQGILDPQGAAVQRSLRKLGFDVSAARVGRVIDLELDADGANDARGRIERMFIARTPEPHRAPGRAEPTRRERANPRAGARRAEGGGADGGSAGSDRKQAGWR